MSIVHSEALPYLASLPAASVDLFVVDPPYNIHKCPEWDSWPTDAAYLAWLRLHLYAMCPTLTPNGSLYLFAAPQLAAKVEVLVGEVFHVLNQIVWVKTTGTTNQRAERAMLRSYLTTTERIIFAEQYGSDTSYDSALVSENATYWEACEHLKTSIFGAYLKAEFTRASVTPRDIAGLFPSATGGMTGCVSNWLLGYNCPTPAQYTRMRDYLNTRNGHTDYLRREYEDLRREYEDLRREYEDLRRPFTVTANGYETEVWRFAVVPPGPDRHSCEKPLALLKHLITTSSRPGAVVCDPFCGSGSTLDAARQLNRRYLGCDSDPVWVRRAQQRLASPYTLELFAPREGV